ncbi:MAG: hypothetical protein PF638_14280 [Candidatus Delongbacteria bacterium]|jgi:hypothetical protein|nr:hypothetical protein [Candidatus Delongbacteria bacterium]
MKEILLIILTILFSLNAQALFEVKDASDHSVFKVSDDGLMIFNYPDTLMIINSSEVRVNLDNTGKGLSRSFSVSTNTTSKGALANVLEVGTQSTTLREGESGEQYTQFTPENLFIGLNAGINNNPVPPMYGMNNIFLGNSSGISNQDGSDNIFIGDSTGFSNINTNKNIFIGNLSGFNTESDDALSDYGSSNIFIGVKSGYHNIEGMHSVYVGTQTGEMNYNGTANVFIGSLTGKDNNSNYNTAVGGTTFYKNTSGSSNTTLGCFAGYNSISGSRNVFLGYKAGYNETGSDRLYIDNTDTSTPLIWGNFSNNTLRFNDNVGIGVAPNITYGLYVKEDYRAIYGDTDTSTEAFTYGIYGDADGGTTRNVSIYGSGASGTGTNWAGYFLGDINVTGTVAKSADEVKIDHPLDPENKSLSHSTISSDQMTNLYHGNVILNNEGIAEVTLPDWFESINSDYRYQLTAIGAPGPNLYISKKVSGNSFEISGGTVDMEVSWQITAIRNDRFAQKNPLQVEKYKEVYEQGYYIHPAAYDLPEEKGIEDHIQKIENR